ncbi:MAG: trehalose-phosphatase, partial [Solirubrobacterales bacterium]|nr:trehalose-phosphatase [Solirubrobacterales bacterium]
LERAAIRVEDKGPIVALHWRGAVEEKEAERLVEGVATIARKQGLVVHLGRKVLELRPAVPLDKGIAIEALLGESPARMALYAGDDRTDLDGFATLVRLRDQGRLDHIVRVGVRSPEGPAELAGATDVLVADPGEVVELLEAMAG